MLAGLPTAEEIARRMRRQPIGVVLADLCLDFGIDATHPLWRDLQIAIIGHGGNLLPLLDAWLQRGANRWKIAEREAAEQAVPEQGSALSVAQTPEPPLPAPTPVVVTPVPVAPADWGRPPILGTPPPAHQAA